MSDEHDRDWIVTKVDDELRELGRRGPGNFRVRLFEAAAIVYRAVGVGVLDEEEAEERLTAAILRAWDASPDQYDAQWIAEGREKAEAEPWRLKVALPDDTSEEAVTDPQNPQNGTDDFLAADPTPLGREPVTLPTAAAGPIVGPLAEAIGEAYQVPVDLAVNLALALVTTAARGRWTVEVAPGWSEVLGLATVSALASGERKSPVLNLLSRPLAEHERDRQAEDRSSVAASVAARKLKTERVEKLRKDAVRTGTDEDAGAYVEAEKELAELVDTVSPRWLVDDATPERLVSLLGEQGGALGVVSTEPGLFAILAGRYSNGAPNLEGVLKATSGDAVKVDRQGREPVVVDRPCLSLALCIQPGLLPELGRGTFRPSGLLSRFLFVLPSPRIGRRRIDVDPVPAAVLDRWSAHLRDLAAEGEKGEPRVLRLDERAAQAFRAFRESLEPRLHPHYGALSSVGDWGSKLPGTTARIAGALALLADPATSTIDGPTMTGAIALANAYTEHALAAFGMVHGRGDSLERAREVLGWLVRHGEETFSVREVWQALRGRAWVQDTDAIRAALGTLIQYGHVERIEREEGRPGRPSERYRVHPLDLALDVDTRPQNPHNARQSDERGGSGGSGDAPGTQSGPSTVDTSGREHGGSGDSGGVPGAPDPELWRVSGRPVRQAS